MTDANVAVTPEVARARRLRIRTIFGIAIVAGLILIATTQPWWSLVVSGRPISVAGTVAAPALSALALSDLALAAALAIAGPFFRAVLGILQLLIAFTVTLTSALSLSAPDSASAALVTKATGVSGTKSIAELVSGVAYTPWGMIAIGLGVLAFLAGVFLLATFRRWPVASRKYQAVRLSPADGPRDAVVDWDALSDGEDPTER
jgi:hypothetical protein